MRYAAFLLGVLAGVLEFAGAIMGLGIAGVGFVFGPGAMLPTSLGVGFAMACATASIFAATLVMFVRNARPLALFLVVASIGAAFAGGPYALPGALSGVLAGALAFRLDPLKPLV